MCSKESFGWIWSLCKTSNDWGFCTRHAYRMKSSILYQMMEWHTGYLHPVHQLRNSWDSFWPMVSEDLFTGRNAHWGKHWWLDQSDQRKEVSHNKNRRVDDSITSPIRLAWCCLLYKFEVVNALKNEDTSCGQDPLEELFQFFTDSNTDST